VDPTVDHDLRPLLDDRSPKPYNRYVVEDLHAHFVGSGLENTLGAVFGKDRGAFGIVTTEGESLIGYGIVHILAALIPSKTDPQQLIRYLRGDLISLWT
jgi:hypothetical protein